MTTEQKIIVDLLCAMKMLHKTRGAWCTPDAYQAEEINSIINGAKKYLQEENVNVSTL